eukprot:2934285-Amphidinium_carterae.2
MAFVVSRRKGGRALARRLLFVRRWWLAVAVSHIRSRGECIEDITSLPRVSSDNPLRNNTSACTHTQVRTPMLAQ